MTCLDCGKNVWREYYMVHDSVWPIAKDAGQLCIGCLEHRIGRSLTAADFTPAPLNWSPHISRSKRLQSRLDGIEVPPGARDPLANSG